MPLSIVAGAKPAFLSPNYFSRQADLESDLVVSSGGTLQHRLYDNDKRAQWTSAGSNDATQESIVAGFYLPGMQTARDIDFVALLGHNLDDFDVELSADNGGTYPTSLISATGETNSYTRAAPASTQSGNKIRITMDTTQTANQEKLVGAVYAASLRFQASAKMTAYDVLPPITGHKTGRMHDRSIRRAYTFRSDASFHLYNARVQFIVDTAAELENFRDLFNDFEPFLFMPRPGDAPNDIWLCQIRPGSYNDAPFHRAQQDVHLVDFIVEEVGRS